MSTGLCVSWDQLSRADWDAAHGAARASYQQDWAYGEVFAAKGARVLRGCVSRPDGSTLALAQVVARPFALVARFALCTHGPAWVGEIAAEDKRAAYRALKSSLPLAWPKLLIFTPDEARAPDAGLGGLKRVMTGDATVTVDLSADADAMRARLDPKWRNKLGKAAKSKLRFSRGGSRPQQYRWLLEAESKQREARGYRALPGELTEAWQTAKAAASGADKAGGVALFRADAGRDPAGGMLFLIHGKRATYHIGWTSEEGRAGAAHNLLLWNAMNELKAEGIETLDLGGVNTQSGAGVARFKMGTGGDVLQRAGAFV